MVGAEPAGVAGPLLWPDDPDAAAEAAGFNLAVVHRPALVVGATGVEDVAGAVRWAAHRRMPVAVQATGHGAVGPVDGGVLVTTRRMKRVTVDPVARLARVEAGVLNHELVAAAAPHGLAPLTGTTRYNSAVGFATGGGLSIVARTFGLGADRVRGFEIVTADGRVRRVDEESEPDLFWAVRGGQGAFGIVTSMEVELIPMPRVWGGGLFFPGEAAAGVLHAYREWGATLPDAVTTFATLVRPPGAPSIAAVYAMHVGDPAAGERLLTPLRGAGPVLQDTFGERSYADLGAVFHEDPMEPAAAWLRGGLLAGLPEAAIDRLLEAAGAGLVVGLRQLGGALGRPPRSACAVAVQDGAFAFNTVGVLTAETAGPVRRATAECAEALRPWTMRGGTLNFLGSPTTPEGVAATWPAPVYERLRAVKRSVDPDDLFRFGHAIPPAP